jgi:hypothetical protein
MLKKQTFVFYGLSHLGKNTYEIALNTEWYKTMDGHPQVLISGIPRQQWRKYERLLESLGQWNQIHSTADLSQMPPEWINRFKAIKNRTNLSFGKRSKFIQAKEKNRNNLNLPF